MNQIIDQVHGVRGASSVRYSDKKNKEKVMYLGSVKITLFMTLFLTFGSQKLIFFIFYFI